MNVCKVLRVDQKFCHLYPAPPGLSAQGLRKIAADQRARLNSWSSICICAAAEPERVRAMQGLACSGKVVLVRSEVSKVIEGVRLIFGLELDWLLVERLRAIDTLEVVREIEDLFVESRVEMDVVEVQRTIKDLLFGGMVIEAVEVVRGIEDLLVELGCVEIEDILEMPARALVFAIEVNGGSRV